MKRNKKYLSIVLAIVAVCLVTVVAYFSIKGSASVNSGTTLNNVAQQGSEAQKNEEDKTEPQESEKVQQGVSAQYVIVTQQGTTAKSNEAAQNEDSGPTKDQVSFTKKNNDPLSNEVDFDSIRAKYSLAIDTIEKGYKNFQTEIDVSDLKITYPVLRDIVKYLSIGHGYYYVKSAYNYSTAGDYVLEYNPEYFFNANDIKKVDKQINDEVERIANEAAQMKTDLEKFLYIHNSLVLSITYGAENTDRDNNLYGAFVLKNTLCTGYSEAFSMIASKLGLKSWVVTSDKLGHAWNLVLLNGRYYYVDCAWDDPTFSNQSLVDNPVSGYGRYLYFMCSEENFYKNDHDSKDWAVNGISVMGLAASTFYDDFFWRDYETLMKPSLGNWYQNYSYDIKNAKPEQVRFSIDKITFSNNENYTIRENRMIYSCWQLDGSYYPVFYSTLQSYDGAVYYMKADGIYKINESGSYNGSKDVCVFKNPRNDSIYDFYIDKSKKTFTVAYGKTMDNNSSNAMIITYNISDYKF